MTTDALMESTNPSSMLAQADGMAQWSESKKNEFCSLFEKRAKFARLLCSLTASKFAEGAKRRHFISEYHLDRLERKTSWRPSTDKWNYEGSAAATGRSWDELERLAGERAKTLLKELPPLKKAVEVIDVETSKKIGRLDLLKKKAQELVEQIEELPTSIDMDDVDQNMTVGEFRAHVKLVFEQRKELVLKLNKVGKEAQDLEISIEKKLYKGLPGLSDAVIDVLEAHLDRDKGLSQMERRVTEQVKFGDSDAAMGALSQFEKDEEEVSQTLKNGLDKALSALKASVKEKAKERRALKKKGE